MLDRVDAASRGIVGIAARIHQRAYNEAFYDSYNELNRALFLITQTVVAGMVAGVRAAPSLTSACEPKCRAGETGYREVPG